MEGNLGLFFGSIAVMWALQMYFTYRQSLKFTGELKVLRQQGRSAIGMGGKLFKGGRAFVAVAEKDGIVVDARVMTGFTVLAAPKPLPSLKGLSLTLLAGDSNIAGMKDKVRSAARMAAETLLKQPASGEQSPTADSTQSE